ncbi:methionine/alanine import family NSS transporter small subunit [Nocardioides euryhalodurans]|uniref:Methionine/alanine import family NSS transporter small subunit n=1 Tax=Nocardioides euryhalodurans TaxID=2518370 RepID=A0A4P7GL56_9ACTN|nr:methionine/alanine import family NSS transporter small subunit [Nocardioides euryhalodurans]QBR92825.1 methionine/alanine import family NSS transporter small subunit [Nocardioides euryhalodurans]
MNASAVVLMLVAMLVIWGGLAVAVVNLNRSKDTPTADEVHRDL